MNILGLDYSIVSKKLKDKWGECDFAKQRIIVDRRLPQQTQESTVLHEILEALRYYLRVDLTHRDLMALEAGLYQTLTSAGVDLSPLLISHYEKGAGDET